MIAPILKGRLRPFLPFLALIPFYLSGFILANLPWFTNVCIIAPLIFIKLIIKNKAIFNQKSRPMHLIGCYVLTLFALSSYDFLLWISPSNLPSPRHDQPLFLLASSWCTLVLSWGLMTYLASIKTSTPRAFYYQVPNHLFGKLVHSGISFASSHGFLYLTHIVNILTIKRLITFFKGSISLNMVEFVFLFGFQYLLIKTKKMKYWSYKISLFLAWSMMYLILIFNEITSSLLPLPIEVFYQLNQSSFIMKPPMNAQYILSYLWVPLIGNYIYQYRLLSPWTGISLLLAFYTHHFIPISIRAGMTGAFILIFPWVQSNYIDAFEKPFLKNQGPSRSPQKWVDTILLTPVGFFILSKIIVLSLLTWPIYCYALVLIFSMTTKECIDSYKEGQDMCNQYILRPLITYLDKQFFYKSFAE